MCGQGNRYFSISDFQFWSLPFSNNAVIFLHLKDQKSTTIPVFWFQNQNISLSRAPWTHMQIRLKIKETVWIFWQQKQRSPLKKSKINQLLFINPFQNFQLSHDTHQRFSIIKVGLSMILNLISFETKDDIVQIPLDGLVRSLMVVFFLNAVLSAAADLVS